jgi:hypothetical protein
VAPAPAANRLDLLDADEDRLALATLRGLSICLTGLLGRL